MAASRAKLLAHRKKKLEGPTSVKLLQPMEAMAVEEPEKIKEKIASLREIISKAQSGEGSITAPELKEKTDELQNASLTLFDALHKARAADQNQQNPEGQQGEQPKEGGEEKKQ